MLKSIVLKVEKYIKKLKRNIVLLKVPLEQHHFPQINHIDDMFKDYKAYHDCKKSKRQSLVNKIESSSR
jgi:hypothetical protein